MLPSDKEEKSEDFVPKELLGHPVYIPHVERKNTIADNILSSQKMCCRRTRERERNDR